MKNYAYLTEAGILHLVNKEETALQEIRKGKIVETGIEARGGYPVVNGEEIIVYNETTMKLAAKDTDTLDVLKYPQLAELYKKCRQ